MCRNLTGSKISTSSTKFVCRADRKNIMATPASDLLRHFRLLIQNRWTEFNKTWQEARTQHPPPSLCFGADYFQHVFHFKKRYSCERSWPFRPLVLQTTVTTKWTWSILEKVIMQRPLCSRWPDCKEIPAYGLMSVLSVVHILVPSPLLWTCWILDYGCTLITTKHYDNMLFHSWLWLCSLNCGLTEPSFVNGILNSQYWSFKIIRICRGAAEF